MSTNLSKLMVLVLTIWCCMVSNVSFADAARREMRSHSTSKNGYPLNGLIEITLGALLGGSTPYLFPAHKQSAELLKNIERRLARGSYDQKTANWARRTIRLKQAGYYGLIGASVIIATDGLAYLFSNGQYTLLGSIYQMLTNSRGVPQPLQDEARYYRSSAQAFQEFLMLSPEEQQALQAADGNLDTLMKIASRSSLEQAH